MSRSERYRNRLQENGEDTSLLGTSAARQHSSHAWLAGLLLAAGHLSPHPAVALRCRPHHRRPSAPACAPPADQDNPLPGFIDPITMGPVVRPAISPFGYVAGLATWKVSGHPGAGLIRCELEA